MFIDGISVGTTPANPDGTWSLTVTGPSNIGSHHVTATCDGVHFPEDSDSSSSLFNELIVEPKLAPVATPPSYHVSQAPGKITISGNYCINSEAFGDSEIGPELLLLSSEFSSTFSSTSATTDTGSSTTSTSAPPPSVTVTFQSDTGAPVVQHATASSNQPFSETWSLDFTNVPKTPGAYVAHVMCGYLDLQNIADTAFSNFTDSTFSSSGSDFSSSLFDALGSFLDFSKVKSADVTVTVLPDPAAVQGNNEAANPVVASPNFTG